VRAQDLSAAPRGRATILRAMLSGVRGEGCALAGAEASVNSMSFQYEGHRGNSKVRKGQFNKTKIMNNIIWFHTDWAKPSVIKAMPHPDDWGIGHWEFEAMSKFISARRSEVKRIAILLQHDDPWFGHEIHRDPLDADRLVTVHTSVTDRRHCGIAIVSSVGTEVVTVVTPARLREFCARHIARKVKFIDPVWQKRIYDEIRKHRYRGNTLAFTTPARGHQSLAPRAVLHDYERALIRAMALCLAEEDAAIEKLRAAQIAA
jgi:hypothetical protein